MVVISLSRRNVGTNISRFKEILFFLNLNTRVPLCELLKYILKNLGLTILYEMSCKFCFVTLFIHDVTEGIKLI